MVKRKNQHIVVDGDVCRIAVKGGFEVLFDIADAGLLSQYCWSIDRRKTNTYAISRSGGKIVRMHRVLLDCGPKGTEVVDHINGNGLDNRRCNLRTTSVSVNSLNQFSVRGRSKYRGVSRSSSAINPWRASVCVRGEHIHIGVFATEESAAAAYNAALKNIVDAKVNENDVDGHVIRNSRWQCKFKGVLMEKSKFVARIWFEGKMIRLGTFANEDDAARAHDRAAKIYHGEFAYLNFPEIKESSLLWKLQPNKRVGRVRGSRNLTTES